MSGPRAPSTTGHPAQARRADNGEVIVERKEQVMSETSASQNPQEPADQEHPAQTESEREWVLAYYARTSKKRNMLSGSGSYSGPRKHTQPKRIKR